MGWKVIPITLGQGVRPMGGTKPTTVRFELDNVKMLREIQNAALPIKMSDSDAANFCISMIRMFIDRQRLDLAVDGLQELKRLLCPHIYSHRSDAGSTETVRANPAKISETVKERKSA